MANYAKKLLILALLGLAAACNPTYLPIDPTGIAQVDEFEAGGYASFGYVGRTIRPLGFRGLVANFGVYFRKGVSEGVDLTLALDNCSINTAVGFRQDKEANMVLRPRVGIGWMAGFAGLDYSYRLSEGEATNYSVGGSAFAWLGDAYWTDDPGKSWGTRVGGFGYAGAEPRHQSTVSGGARLDWAPFQFGGRGARETLVDLFGGNRNPYAEPLDRSVLTGWPRPAFAFEPGALMITGGPAITYHRDGGNWTQGGEDDSLK